MVTIKMRLREMPITDSQKATRAYLRADVGFLSSRALMDNAVVENKRHKVNDVLDRFVA